MRRLKKSIVIEAPPERVFELLATPQNLPRIWPSMIDVHHVEKRADGSFAFDWLYKMGGVLLRGRAKSSAIEPNRYLELKNETGVRSTLKWILEPHGSGTMLTSEVEYEIPLPVLGKVAEALVAKLNDREQRILLENAKTALELGPKPTANGAAASAAR